jgi:hypothetical protein
MLLSKLVGELEFEEGALDVAERIDSSLILVFKGSITLIERSAPCAAALIAS